MFQEYLGIIVAIFLPLSFYISWIQSGKIQISIYPLSKFGELKETKLLFDSTLIIVGIFQLIFSIYLMNYFSINSFLLTLLISISLISFGSIGIFNSEKFKIFHRYLVVIYFFTVVIWIIIVSFKLLEIDYVVGLVALLISLNTLVGVLILFFKYGKNMYFEIYLLFNTMIWNLFFSYIILT